ASAPIVAGPLPRRSRMARRVGSERAKKLRARGALWGADRGSIGPRAPETASARPHTAKGGISMSKVTFDMSVSLDGFTNGADHSPDHPMGADGMRVHDWAFGGDGADRAGLD